MDKRSVPRVGDWVRVVRAPRYSECMAPEARAAFQTAVGRTFRVEEVRDDPDLGVDIGLRTSEEKGTVEGTEVVTSEMIWIEPDCLEVIEIESL